MGVSDVSDALRLRLVTALAQQGLALSGYWFRVRALPAFPVLTGKAREAMEQPSG